MKKSLLFMLACICLSWTAMAQTQLQYNGVKKMPALRSVRHSAAARTTAGACDTVNLDESSAWNAVLYNTGGGPLTGINSLSVSGLPASTTEQAQLFDLSGTDNSYLTGTLVYFGYANTSDSADLKKNVIFKVYDYDETSGLPGSLLGSAALPLSSIKADVDENFLTEVMFPDAIELPASQKFFLSVDMSNFKWSKDSVAVVSSTDDDTENAAYQLLKIQQIGSSWLPVNELWVDNNQNPLDISLYIFPYVNNSADGCTTLPVTLKNFSASLNNNQVNLTWSTATENNNKGFYVERSKDGHTFSSIGFIEGAGTSAALKNYSFTDVDPMKLATSVAYYRLKQVDMDGKYIYSDIKAVNLKSLVNWRVYPNPVTAKSVVEITLTEQAKLALQIISVDGKTVQVVNKGILNNGTYTIPLNMFNLKSGTYYIKLIAGDKTYTTSVTK